MNIQSPAASTIPVATRRFFSRRAGISTAALLALCAVEAYAQTFTWTNPDLTSPPGATQAWSDGANWNQSGAVPVDGAVVQVYRTGNAPAFVLLDTQTNLVGTTNVNYGTELLINASGEFRNGLSGRLDIGANAASTVTVQSGGKITLADGTLGGNVRIQLQNGSTLNTAGVINHNVLTVQSGSTVNMTGGSITTRQSPGALLVIDSSFNQSAGAVSSADVRIQRGTYRVSGGSITTSHGTSGLYFSGANTTTGSRFEVQGSGTTLNFSSFRNDDTGVDIVRPTFAFVLDNSSQHISKINFAADGNTGAALRTNADLEVSLAGGVLLSGTDNHTVIQRVSGTDTAWNNAASLTGLWVDATDNTNGTTKADIKIGLNVAAFQGNLDVLGNTSLSFGSAAHGYVTLDGVDGQSFQLGLDIVGGTLGNFTSALTEAGIGWTAGTGDYEVILDLDAAVSGGNYFAWDFSTIDDAMGLQGIGMMATIPEPSSFVVIAGSGVLGIVVMLRRRRIRA